MPKNTTDIDQSQKFKPGDRVKVEFETTVGDPHDSVSEVVGKVWIANPASGLTTRVPIDAVTKIAPPMPQGIGAVIRHKGAGEFTVRIAGNLWAYGKHLLEDAEFQWERTHDMYEVLSEGVEI
jgi:hypothetical protein